MSGENISLYYREGTSDKIYQTSLTEKDGGFVVNFAYGRRGSTLQTGTKTPAPVGYEAAKKVYDKLVHEKTAKGYTPGLNGTPYAHTDNEQRTTGILPQLLNAVEEADVEKLLTDQNYWMQQKFDGKRVLVECQEGKITGINRKGLTIGLSSDIVDSAKSFGHSFILDGEAIGDRLYAFDLLSINGVDLRSQPYRDRHEQLFRLIDESIGTIEFVETFCSTASKSAAYDRLKDEKAEGVVFKRHAAPYSSGRPASGGPQLKFKFYATGTFIVAGVNGSKRSVGLDVYSDIGTQYIGNVTIPTNQKMPKKGAFVEVR